MILGAAGWILVVGGTIACSGVISHKLAELTEPSSPITRVAASELLEWLRGPALPLLVIATAVPVLSGAWSSRFMKHWPWWVGWPLYAVLVAFGVAAVIGITWVAEFLFMTGPGVSAANRDIRLVENDQMTLHWLRTAAPVTGVLLCTSSLGVLTAGLATAVIREIRRNIVLRMLRNHRKRRLA